MGSMDTEYDDRKNQRYSLVQAILRRRMRALAGVLSFSLVVALLAIAQRGLSLTSPRDLAILALVAFFACLDLTSLYLIKKEVFYVVKEGHLEFPRWGGLRRSVVPLADLGAFYREGRDEAVAKIVILAGGRRFLVIPEFYLTNPSGLLRLLREGGIKELPARFRPRHNRP